MMIIFWFVIFRRSFESISTSKLYFGHNGEERRLQESGGGHQPAWATAAVHCGGWQGEWQVCCWGWGGGGEVLLQVRASLGSQKGRTLERACTEADWSKYDPYLSPLLLSFVYPLQKEKAVMDAQEEVNKAIKARKKMLKAGSYVYEIDIKSAEHTWKVWWPSSLLFYTALSLLLLHDFFLSLSFPQPPSHSPHSELIVWMQGATNLPWPQASVGRMKLDLSSSFFDLIEALGEGISPSVYILKNGHKWLTLFYHLSCAAAGWQARSSTWEDIGSWCLSAPLQGKDSGHRGPSSGDRVQIFDCKWVTKTR